jgi:hypothetical protein
MLYKCIKLINYEIWQNKFEIKLYIIHNVSIDVEKDKYTKTFYKFVHDRINT